MASHVRSVVLRQQIVGGSIHGLSGIGQSAISALRYTSVWCLRDLHVYPAKSAAPPQQQIRKALHSMWNYFSSRQVWREQLWSIENHRSSTRKAIVLRR